MQVRSTFRYAEFDGPDPSGLWHIFGNFLSFDSSKGARILGKTAKGVGNYESRAVSRFARLWIWIVASSSCVLVLLIS
jgi:hypothetical protein